MASAMNIAIWWQQESWGGVDTHLATLLDAWPGPDTFTIFHNGANPGLKRIGPVVRRRNIKTVAVPEWRRGKPGRLGRIFNYGLLPLHFWRWKRRARDILGTHGPFDALIADNGSYPGAWTCLAALSAAQHHGIRKRMLLVHHAATPLSVGRSLFERAVDRCVQSWATDIVAISRATRDTLIKIRLFDTERNPIRVIHNGVRLPAEAGTKLGLRREWEIPDGEIVLGMMGRIERYKGHEDVLLAMAELPDDMRGRVRLIVVGEGPTEEKTRLRVMAQKLGLGSRVLFTGYVDAESSSIAGEFDLLVMATKDFEGFGLAAAEAMAVGTPVLATAVGGAPEFINDHIALLVPPESPSDIAAAIETFIRDPNAAQRRAQQARQHIAKFSDVAMAKRFQRLISL
jgi:glycosyltransferase involved in cell wall biosynthesis